MLGGRPSRGAPRHPWPWPSARLSSPKRCHLRRQALRHMVTGEVTHMSPHGHCTLHDLKQTAGLQRFASAPRSSARRAQRPGRRVAAGRPGREAEIACTPASRFCPRLLGRGHELCELSCQAAADLSALAWDKIKHVAEGAFEYSQDRICLLDQ